MPITLMNPTEPAGQVQMLPRVARFQTTDSLATVTTAGYLTPQVLQGFPLSNGDVAIVTLQTSNTISICRVSLSAAGIYTLVSTASGTTGSTTVGDFAVFNDEEGDLIDLGYLPSNPALTKVAMVDGAVTAGHVAIFDADGSVADGGAFAYQPKVYNVTVGEAALASAGSVTLISSSGSKQFQILAIASNKGGTNFSGGGGDRLGQITDGTTVYSVIPAASLQTLANVGWGATGVPYPASAAINTATAAGAALTFKYSGGTTDYSAGSVVITVLAIEVA